jgi:hypothetical protein
MWTSRSTRWQKGLGSAALMLPQIEQARVVVFDPAWPPPARNLHLGTALLAPSIELHDEVDGYPPADS